MVIHGPYCSECGQHDIDYHRSFHHLAHDLLENLFHFEGKFFTSVGQLLAKPGRLTLEFNAGRRQNQFNPLRFYLFVTILFFLGVHLLNHGHLFAFDRKAVDSGLAAINDNTNRATAATRHLTPTQRERVFELVGEISGERGGRLEPQEIDTIVAQVQRELPVPSGVQAIDSVSGFEALLRRQLTVGRIAPSEMFDAMESRVPTLLFLGMPIFALLLKALHRDTNRYYVEHLIFALHMHTWVFLMIMVSAGYLRIAAFGPAWLLGSVACGLVGWMGWYVFTAFRTVYGQSAAKIGVKLTALAFGYGIALTGMAALMIAVSLTWLVYT